MKCPQRPKIPQQSPKPESRHVAPLRPPHRPSVETRLAGGADGVADGVAEGVADGVVAETLGVVGSDTVELEPGVKVGVARLADELALVLEAAVAGAEGAEPDDEAPELLHLPKRGLQFAPQWSGVVPQNP